MPPLHPSGFIAALLLLGAAPSAAAAQQGSLVASATVVGRPLMLRGVEPDAAFTALWVAVDGCGGGALTVHARTTSEPVVRLARQAIAASARCERRDLLVSLPPASKSGGESWEVALVQGDGLLAPAVSIVVITAATTRISRQRSLIY